VVYVHGSDIYDSDGVNYLSLLKTSLIFTVVLHLLREILPLMLRNYLTCCLVN